MFKKATVKLEGFANGLSSALVEKIKDEMLSYVMIKVTGMSFNDKCPEKMDVVVTYLDKGIECSFKCSAVLSGISQAKFVNYAYGIWYPVDISGDWEIMTL